MTDTELFISTIEEIDDNQFDPAFLEVVNLYNDMWAFFPILAFIVISYLAQRMFGKSIIFKKRNNVYLAYLKSNVVIVVEVLRVFLSVVSLGIFGYLSYLISVKVTNKREFQEIFEIDSSWYLWLEFGISCLFALYYVAQMLFYPNVFEYVSSPVALANFLNTLQGLQIAFPGQGYYSWFFLPFRCFSIYDGLYVLNRKLSDGGFTTKRNEIIFYLITIFCFLFGVSGTIFTMENIYLDGQLLDLFEAFYFIIISLTTVGYGDFYPVTPLGKVTICIIIVAAIAIIPKLTNDLVGILTNKRTNTVDYSTTHCVLYVERSTNVEFFIREFFHEDRQFSSVNLAIISEDLHENVKRLISLPFFRIRTDYLQGDLTFMRDRIRCKTQSADAVFFLISDDENNDAKNILTSFLLKRENPKIKILMQVLNEDTKENELEKEFSKRKLKPWKFLDEVAKSKQEKLDANPIPVFLSLEEVKMRLLAHSCKQASYTTILANLFTSTTTKNKIQYPHNPFLDEYEHGLGIEIYTFVDLSSFEGESFEYAVLFIYQQFGCILIGLIDKSTTPILNPQKFEISNAVTGIVLAQDDRDVAKIIHRGETPGIDQLFEDYPEKTVKYVKPIHKTYNDCEPRKLEDCMLYSVKDIIHDQIIVVTKRVTKGMRSLIKNLRSRYHKNITQIIFLCPEKPTATVWSYLTQFPGVYFIKGDGNNEVDLIRAGIEYASTVIIEASGNTIEDDARSVLSFKLVEGIVRNYQARSRPGEDKPDKFRCKPIVEIMNNESSRFMSKTSITGDLGEKQKSENERDKAGAQNNVYYLAGQIFYPNIAQNIIAQDYFSDAALQIFMCLTEAYSIRVNNWEYIDLFENMRHVNYDQVFQYYLYVKGLIPIAIIRKGLYGRYPITTPPQDMLLQPKDQIVCINAMEVPRKRGRGRSIFARKSQLVDDDLAVNSENIVSEEI